MKKRKYNLLVLSVGLFLVFIVLILVLNIVLFGKFGRLIQTGNIVIAIVLELIILFFVFVIFRQYIYIPVKQLNRTLDKWENGSDSDETAHKGVYLIEDRINGLIEELMKSMEREHKEALLRQQFQYAELQNQINPHFLYNTLETIRGQAIIDDNYKIADMTETLAKYFRYNISKNKDDVTVEQELENIKNYIHIQQYRFQDRFRYQVYAHVPHEEYAYCLIPKMTLQPIVENSIFHGIEQKVDMGNIIMHIDANQDKLIIIVADNGVGISPEKLEELNQKLNEKENLTTAKTEQHGIAMVNVHHRLQMLYGEDFGLEIRSTQGYGTKVEITFPKTINKELEEKWLKKNC